MHHRRQMMGVKKLRPAAPTNVAGETTGSTTILVSWTDNSNNEAQFEVWASESFEGQNYIFGYTRRGTVAAGVTSFQITNLNPGVPYYIFVKAVAANDGLASSSASNIIGTSTWSLEVAAYFATANITDDSERQAYNSMWLETDLGDPTIWPQAVHLWPCSPSSYGASKYCAITLTQIADPSPPTFSDQWEFDGASQYLISNDLFSAMGFTSGNVTVGAYVTKYFGTTSGKWVMGTLDAKDFKTVGIETLSDGIGSIPLSGYACHKDPLQAGTDADNEIGCVSINGQNSYSGREYLIRGTDNSILATPPFLGVPVGTKCVLGAVHNKDLGGVITVADHIQANMAAAWIFKALTDEQVLSFHGNMLNQYQAAIGRSI